uniref:Uncharacterized protein n=1 Tax=Desulfurella acetivorans TaxID=33002 RepID=A0A832EXH8_DESAE
MWLDFNGFEINRDNKNKITNIKILNAKGSKEEDFVTFAALLRYFLNKNNFNDGILIELTGFINKLKELNVIEKNSKFEALFTETYDVVLKTAPHNGKRYLEIETQKRYWYADSNVNKAEIKSSINELEIKDYYNEEFKDYYDKKIKMDFEPQKKQIPEIFAQIWLESLNKYHV